MKHFLLLMLKRVVLLNILVETAWEFVFFYKENSTFIWNRYFF